MASAARVLLGLLVLALASGACGKSDAQPPPARGAGDGIKPIPITTARVETREVQRTVETIGSLLPWEDVQVKTEQPGTVARLLVDLGDLVARGTVLAQYDAREFQLAVAQAEADLLAARESLARARASVEASEAALRRVRENRSALDADVDRARSQLEWARSELERAQELFRKELIAARDVDNARNQHNVAAAQLAVANNTRALHPDQVRIAEAQLAADRAALRVADAEVARREAALGIVRKRLADTTITSPIAGAVAKRHINAGEYVKENTVVFTVVALDPLKYTGSVPERFAPEVRTGQRIDLSVEAYPGTSFVGTVTRVAPGVEVQTRSLALEGQVPNRGGRLRPGFFAKGQVLTRKDPAVAFVPAEAVVYFVGISKVFVVGEGKVEERQVRSGAREGGRVEIKEGVKAGETVALSNLPQLFDGAPVTVVTGAASR